MNINGTANHTKSNSHLLHRAAQATKRTFKKYFIAHEENDHHPHIFRMKAVISFLICLVIIEGGLYIYANDHVQRQAALNSNRASVIASALVAYTNDARTSESLPALTRNSNLDAAAQLKAQDMVEKGYFAHYAPDGTAPWHWIDAAGYKYGSAGENLAIDFFDSKDVVDAWMKSPTHRANIVKQKYTEIGMAVAEGQFNNRQTIFVVQFFAVPAAPAVVAANTLTNSVTSTLSPATAPAPSPAPAASATSAPVIVAAANPRPVVIANPALASQDVSSTTPASAGSASSTATSTATSSPAIAGATTTPTSTVAASEGTPEVAGLFTEKDPGLFAKVSGEMFGFVASPRNTIEAILFILIACVLLATLLYMHSSKKPNAHRIVAIIAVSLVILLTLLIMMNRTLLRMSDDSLLPPAETVLEIEAGA